MNRKALFQTSWIPTELKEKSEFDILLRPDDAVSLKRKDLYEWRDTSGKDTNAMWENLYRMSKL